MRTMTVVTTTLAAVLTAGALTPASAGEPAEVRWETTVGEQVPQADASMLAMSEDKTTVYALGNAVTPFLQAIDVATGQTRWSASLEQASVYTHLAVDPTTDQIILGGSQSATATNPDGPAVTAFSATGERLWTSTVARGQLFYDLAVDPTDGRVCAVAATSTGRTWSTECMNSSGRPIFRKDFKSRSNTWPNAIEIDSSHRVFVVGPQSVKSRNVVTTVAYSRRGETLWKRSTPVNDISPVVDDVAIDSDTQRLYMVLKKGRQVWLIGQRTTDGKTTLSKTFGSPRAKAPRARYVNVLPTSHRVVVTTHASPEPAGTLRYLNKSGRLVAQAKFSECCNITRPVVDPNTDTISIAWGPGLFDDAGPLANEGAGAATWSKSGKVLTDLDIASTDTFHSVAAVAPSGQDLLLFGKRSLDSTEPPGAFLLSVH